MIEAHGMRSAGSLVAARWHCFFRDWPGMVAICRFADLMVLAGFGA